VATRKSKVVSNAMAYKPKGKMPTLADMTKKVPKGGLLNPKLRKGMSAQSASGKKFKGFKGFKGLKSPKIKGVF